MDGVKFWMEKKDFSIGYTKLSERLGLVSYPFGVENANLNGSFGWTIHGFEKTEFKSIEEAEKALIDFIERAEIKKQELYEKIEKITPEGFRIFEEFISDMIRKKTNGIMYSTLRLFTKIERFSPEYELYREAYHKLYTELGAGSRLGGYPFGFDDVYELKNGHKKDNFVNYMSC